MISSLQLKATSYSVLCFQKTLLLKPTGWGYLNLDKSHEEMEAVGREYFEHLAARSFFQDFEKDDDGNIIICKMHDIAHDFA